MSGHPKLLAVFAHPDDAEFYCAGFVSRLLKEGYEGYYLCMTSGEKGTLNPTAAQGLSRRREREQQRAAERLGIRQVFFFRKRDGELEVTQKTIAKVVALLRRLKPELLFAFDPTTPPYELHPDHLASSLIAIRAAAAAPLPLYFPEARGRHQVSQIYLFASPQPNLKIKLKKSELALKRRALEEHKSQVDFLTELAPGKYQTILTSPLALQVESYRLLDELPYRR